MTLSKTETGQQVLKDRSVVLTPRQRSVFILVDGKRTADQLLAATAAAGVTREDVDKLVELGLVEDTAPSATVPAELGVQQAGGGRTEQERYARAYPVASRLTSDLGLRGFRLNLAVEGATTYAALVEVAPRIREAVGPEKYQALDNALNDYPE
jgi:hypothetical protein